MRILLLSISFVLSVYCQAQVPFLSIVGSNESHNSTASTISNDGTSLFMCGHNTYSHFAEILKFDQYGNVDWSFNYPFGINEMNFMSISQSNQLFVGGSIRDTAFVMALDTNGALIWSRKMKFPGYSYGGVIDIQTDSAGTFLLVGLADSVSSTARVCVCKMNYTGNLIWSKILPFSYALADLAFSPVAHRIGVITVDGGSSILTILDTSGMVVSTRDYPDQLCNIISAWDSGFVVSRFTGGNPVLTHTNAMGNPVWTMVYKDGANWLAPQASMLFSGNYLYFGVYNTNQDAGLLKLDTSGTIIWSKNYSTHLGYGIMQYIAPAPNGNLWMSGMRYGMYDEYFVGQDDTTNSTTCISYPANFTDSSIAIQDSALNISTQIIVPITIAMNEVLTPFVLNQSYECYTSITEYSPESNVNVYPNPATNLTTFKFEYSAKRTVIINNQFGQEIMRIESEAEIVDISVSDLPTGMYYYVVQETQRPSVTGKLMIL